MAPLGDAWRAGAEAAAPQEIEALLTQRAGLGGLLEASEAVGLSLVAEGPGGPLSILVPIIAKVADLGGRVIFGRWAVLGLLHFARQQGRVPLAIVAPFDVHCQEVGGSAAGAINHAAFIVQASEAAERAAQALHGFQVQVLLDGAGQAEQTYALALV